ncbi:Regulator of protease activity HflC, stomatin/prohibitin superfamily [Chryseolinea serpens]|uniref:Regulator of protease activity HflC, stomatin/prohibitin superfamily n=2 Tax=Chryseolinea serpens TaxID=947013 RepID=A0A1M5VI95_9BACT|nr:Regulator of protease activity HflC, stomatin/prohibitin superfamily [Chryseolinea serpens]
MQSWYNFFVVLRIAIPQHQDFNLNLYPMNNRKNVIYIVIGVILLIVLMSLSSSMFYTIGPSERAIIFYKFGKGLDKDNVIEQGFHTKAPWNDLYVYSVNEMSSDENMDVLDKSGLSIHVDVTVRYSPMPEKIGYIQEKFTKNYVNVLVIPEVRSTVRQVMGRYTAEEIYSTKRAEVETAIRTETEKILQLNFVRAPAVLIRSILLPEQIKGAIENKLQQEQEALAYQFRLDKEKSEAERKRIAAEGESRANNIINNSLTNNLLKMRGIEATLELSKSPNAKVIVIGSGGDGMPLILGNN